MTRVAHDELLRRAEAYCRRYDVWVYRRRNSLMDPRGMPDLLMLGTVAAAAREVKTGTGRATPEQIEVGRRLKLAGISWDIWREEDLAMMDAEIAALSGRTPWSQRSH